MTAPDDDSTTHAATERTGQDPPPEQAMEQVEGEGDVGAEGLERRDQEP